MRWCLLLYSFFIFFDLNAQGTFETQFNALKKVNIDSGVLLTFDEPSIINPRLPTKIVVFALPNGNTTAQTFGKNLSIGEDWHFDIQHIGAQTKFIRDLDPKTNYIVVYAENNLKSWPAWRRKYVKADEYISKLVDKVLIDYERYLPKLILTGHSGGGSFIFGYINSQAQIPSVVERIGFLDATYGYETEKHSQKLKKWLEIKNNSLQVIAYNDSVVVYNGKPLVTPTGGTWYRSKLMAKDLRLKADELADRLIFKNRNGQIGFNLLKNPEAKIFHTVLVEKNGFIHAVFNGTRFGSKRYTFWGTRAYQHYVLD